MEGGNLQDKVCKFNQKGFCKHGEKCFKKHENEKCPSKECTDKKCILRHPKLCKFYAQTGKCKFNEDCAFAHEDSEVVKRLVKLESEMENFKSNFMILETKKADANVNSKNSVLDILESEVALLKREMVAINNSLNEQYHMLEALEASISVPNTELKCDVCEYKCKKENTLVKHMNSKYPIITNVTSNKSLKGNDSDCIKETQGLCSVKDDELENWFQAEIIDNEVVYVCNICDEGFDDADKVKEHMSNDHNEEILSALAETSDESTENECEYCRMKSCICEWLNKIDD